MDSLPIFLSSVNDCAYLPEKHARNAFIDPRRHLNTAQREALMQLGFRRSGPSHYRPVCQDCQACQSTRVDIARFQPNRSQRRCYSANADLIASWELPLFSEERFQLYRTYLQQRHTDGGMDPDDIDGFRQFLCSEADNETRHLLIRDAMGELVAVAVADRLLSGYSAVYTFFDPKQSQRSLGRYAVLRLIEASRAARLPWLYLGYFIENCAKMEYKAEYQPQQRLEQNEWRDVVD
ncbi:MAG: arginyltransferase [Oceanococcus sp.]